MIKDGVLNHQLQASSSSPLARLLCCAPELASQGERLRAALEEAAALQNEKHSLTQRVDQLVEKVFNSTRVLVLVLAARALQTAITHALTQHATTATPPPRLIACFAHSSRVQGSRCASRRVASAPSRRDAASRRPTLAASSATVHTRMCRARPVAMVVVVVLLGRIAC